MREGMVVAPPTGIEKAEPCVPGRARKAAGSPVPDGDCMLCGGLFPRQCSSPAQGVGRAGIVVEVPAGLF